MNGYRACEAEFPDTVFWGFRIAIIVSLVFILLLCITKRSTVKTFFWNLVYIFLQFPLGYLLWTAVHNGDTAFRREHFLPFTIAWCLVQLWSFRVFLTRSDPSDSDKPQNGASSGP